MRPPQRGLRKALERSKRGTVESQRVVCLVQFPSGESLCVVNQRSLQGRVSRWTFHAEELALSRIARGSNRGIPTIYVMRFLNSGRLALARPCSGCARLLEAYYYPASPSVYYSTESGEFSQYVPSVQVARRE